MLKCGSKLFQISGFLMFQEKFNFIFSTSLTFSNCCCGLLINVESDFSAFSRCSKECNKLASSETLWTQLFQFHFPNPSSNYSGFGTTKSMKSKFQVSDSFAFLHNRMSSH